MTDPVSSSDVTRRRVAAEWEPQQCVWISWPHHRETWPGHFDAIPEFFARWIRAIAESTPVRVLAAADLAPQCEKFLTGTADVEILDVATNDCWIRDYGPSFVLDENSKALVGIDWTYNAWGGKYPPWDLDQAAAAEICRQQQIPCFRSDLCLEGGAMEFDGLGRMLTTPACLLVESRNPRWTESSVSQELHRQLGVLEIVWLDGGSLAGDDTDGHIDQLARFVDAENVVVAVCDDRSDENREGLEENYRQLKLWGYSTTPRVTVHRLPIPPARFINGQRVPESYCNFLRLGKGRMMVPTFAAPSDDHAVRLLAELSGSEITPIDCRDLVWGLGALHCASRDQPAI